MSIFKHKPMHYMTVYITEAACGIYSSVGSSKYIDQ